MWLSVGSFGLQSDKMEKNNRQLQHQNQQPDSLNQEVHLNNPRIISHSIQSYWKIILRFWDMGGDSEIDSKLETV
jgi:hypothetical protein